jgi:hypothetical protein
MTLIILQVKDDLNIFQMENVLIFLLSMEDDLNILANGRRPHFFLSNGRQPQYIYKWKTTSIFWQMEDDFNISKWKRN